MRNRIISLTAAVVLAMSTFAATVETDRTWYVAGEAMTVRVTADGAMIAYAELCDTHGLAAATIITLWGNEGTGIIELPSELHSGYYVLSAYTRHDAQVAQQLVAIVNPLRKSADDDIEWVEAPACLPQPGEVAAPIASPHKGRLLGTPETEGHIITARIKNVYEGHAFKASQICPSLSIVGKQIRYFEGKMINDSIAEFYTFGIHGRQPLVLSAISSTGVSLPVEIVSPFAVLRPNQLPHLVFHYQRSEVEARSLDMQRRQTAVASTAPSDYDETAYGTRPYLSYNLDEYRQFLTIREVLLEYVRCVSNRRTNGVLHLTVYGEQNPEDSSWPTLVLIDGMPVNDIEQLLNYDARRIHYINIYGGQYTFGNGVYNGILSFVTRSGQLTNFPTAPNTQYLVYDFPE